MIELKDLSQGSRIAYARKYRGLTQSDLGILCGFDPGGAGIRINQYERNHKHPRDDCLKKYRRFCRLIYVICNSTILQARTIYSVFSFGC